MVEKNPAAVSLGQLGGKKSAKSRHKGKTKKEISDYYKALRSKKPQPPITLTNSL